jgi:pilus assembly protein CpaE
MRTSLTGMLVDMVLVNLDPDVEHSLDLVQLVTQLAPPMGILGISQRSDPGTIIQAMRAGCNQFVQSPIEIEDLSTAIQRIQASRQSLSHKSKRVCVVGASGGVGATTVACNLALEMTQVIKQPCALVDLNLEFGDVACAFDCKPKFTLADLCRNGEDLDRTMVEAGMHQLPCNVHVLPRPDKITEAHEVAPEAVERLLDLLQTAYASVVLDVPRMFSFFSSAAVGHADLILIIAQLSVPSIRNARRAYDLLLNVGAREDQVQIVLNRFKADHERISSHDVEKHFGRPVFAKIPNDYRRVMAALDLGRPILTNAPTSPARVAIQEMARKCAADIAPPDEDDEKHSGLLGRLWRRKEPVSKPG